MFWQLMSILIIIIIVIQREIVQKQGQLVLAGDRKPTFRLRCLTSGRKQTCKTGSCNESTENGPKMRCNAEDRAKLFDVL